MTLTRHEANKSDILAGLHGAIFARVVALLKTMGMREKFVITGGIGKNMGVVTKIGEKLDGMKITMPPEPPDCRCRASSPVRTRPDHEKGHYHHRTRDRHLVGNPDYVSSFVRGHKLAISGHRSHYC